MTPQTRLLLVALLAVAGGAALAAILPDEDPVAPPAPIVLPACWQGGVLSEPRADGSCGTETER